MISAWVRADCTKSAARDHRIYRLAAAGASKNPRAGRLLQLVRSYRRFAGSVAGAK
jgi:hypothetical protein